jgi:hypothetical protein
MGTRPGYADELPQTFDRNWQVTALLVCDTKFLGGSGDAGDRRGIAREGGERAPKVFTGRLLFAKDDAGANEAHPALFVDRPLAEALGQPFDHLAYHRLLLIGGQRLDARDVLGRRSPSIWERVLAGSLGCMWRQVHFEFVG